MASPELRDKAPGTRRTSSSSNNNAVDYEVEDRIAELQRTVTDVQDQLSAAECEVGKRGEQVDLLTDRIAFLEASLGNSCYVAAAAAVVVTHSCAVLCRDVSSGGVAPDRGNGG